MDRADATGFSVALVGHAAIIAVFALGLFRASSSPAPSDPIEVSFVEEVALTSGSPTPTATPPAPSVAPALGPTEEAAPVPAPSNVAPRPQPAPPQPTTRPTPPQPRDARDRRRPDESRQGQADRSRGSRLGPDFLKGLGRDPSPSRSQEAPAATMTSQAAANIAQAIARQVQPCADRQVYPGPGAERIVTTLNLRLNRNGSLAGAPRLVRQSGIDDENGRYAQRVADLAIRSFVECSPLRGLPDELYAVPRGWSNFTMNYRMPG
jgi:hypothetical protein